MTPPSAKKLRIIIAKLPLAHGLSGPPPAHKWYSSQHEHWLGWLGEYGDPGYYNRKGLAHDGRFAFNHVSCVEMVTWLAEAAGVDKALVRRALAEAAKVKNPTSKAAAARRILPWDLVWHHLRISVNGVDRKLARRATSATPKIQNATSEAAARKILPQVIVEERLRKNRKTKKQKMIVISPNPGESASIKEPKVRKDFWEFLISQHPIEEEHAKPTKNAYRWRPIARKRLVIVQYVSEQGVGVFVRGERGSHADAVAHQLRPLARRLNKALGVNDVRFRHKSTVAAQYFFQKFRFIESSRRTNWKKMAYWLHREANTYQSALQQIF